MTELTSKEFERQVEEVINLVNENHDKYVRDQERLQEAGNRGFNAKMKNVLNRIMGTPEVVTKKQVIYYYVDKSDRLIIRDSNGNIVGYTSLTKQMESKIELVDNRPIFVLKRGNEVYLRRDVLDGRMKATAVGAQTFKDVSRAYSDSKEMLEGTKKIYELIEAKDYDAIDSFIMQSMEELINNNLDTAPIEQHQVYIEVYVANQRINKLKNSIMRYEEEGKDYTAVVEMLDNEYRIICEKLINNGLYKVPLNR